jgi:tetratricopeptide (TPR) repeat protein
VKNSLLRLGLSFLLIPILPPLLIPDIFDFFKKQKRRAIHYLIFLRRKLKPEERAVAPATAQLEKETFKKLLRAASTESEPFDMLFSAYLIASRQSPCWEGKPPEIRIPTAPSDEAIAARQEYEEIISSDRIAVIWRRKATKVLSKTGKFVSAAFFFLPMMALDLGRRHLKTRKAFRHAIRGEKLLKRGKAEKALKYLQKSVDLYPEQPLFWNNLSLALQQLNRFEEALKAQRRAIEQNYGNPDIPELWYGLGYICWNAGHYEEGAKAFEKAMESAAPGSSVYEESRKGKQYCINNLG